MGKKKTAPTITRDDWMKALAETHASQADSDPALLSYSDFSALMGVVIGTARRQLTALVASGRAVRTTKRVIASDGKCRIVVAFRLVQKRP